MVFSINNFYDEHERLPTLRECIEHLELEIASASYESENIRIRLITTDTQKTSEGQTEVFYKLWITMCTYIIARAL